MEVNPSNRGNIEPWQHRRNLKQHNKATGANDPLAGHGGSIQPSGGQRGHATHRPFLVAVDGEVRAEEQVGQRQEQRLGQRTGGLIVLQVLRLGERRSRRRLGDEVRRQG